MRKGYGLIFFFLAIFSLGFTDFSGGETSFIKAPVQEPRLIINNRPLAKMNGKVISLYDVVKKMDLFLFEYYPDYHPSSVERYQYYMSRWESTLSDMIHDELILLDAAQKEIKISDGAVREELQSRFGPNVMLNLDKINYEYEEAREMVRRQMTVEQLIGMKVHSKAFQLTTPQVIKRVYEEYLQKNPEEEEWTYQVLSIRGKDEGKCAGVAEKAQNLLEKEGQPIEKLPSLLEEEGVTVSLSDDYSGTCQKLSKMHFDVIKALHPNSCSAPIAQVSRFDNNKVIRIFHLKDVLKKLPETLDQMHDRIKNELLFETSDREKTTYIQSLKKRFGYENYNPKYELPEDYQPFILS
jgi:hypothetical protein